MLKEDEFQKEVENIKNIVKEEGLPFALLLKVEPFAYDPNGTANSPNKQIMTVDRIAFTVGKKPFAMYPHLEVRLVSGNDDASYIGFIEQEKNGIKNVEYKFSELRHERLYDIKNFKQFIKDVKCKGLDKDFYIGEKERILGEIDNLNNAVNELTNIIEKGEVVG